MMFWIWLGVAFAAGWVVGWIVLAYLADNVVWR